ncbi:MAG: DUF3857 and transglutaminase domain-containing protein [Acidobacteriota bacterium]|nr:DUF3857 and transglutaminase domain-containing protein [Acidobacteriota bacterium]
MKNQLLQIAVLLLLGFAGVASSHAQFQEPTKEELQMTSDPMAPGAAAVYLYREEKTDDNLHYHSYYERIKVLTEKGKELATVRIPYEHGTFKVTNIEGRTIHPDGTVIKLTTKPADLMDFKSGSTQVNTMVFTLPSVEVGSILEYRLQLRYDDSVVSSPSWDIQQPYFVHKAHYYFSPNHKGGITIFNARGDALNQLMYAVHADGKAQVKEDTTGNFTFDIENVPPTPNEGWMPPLNSLTWKVRFYYTQYHSGQDFWTSEGKRWVKESDNFAKPTNELKQAVSTIVSPGDTDEQKAHKIYDAVMKLENTDYTRKKSDAELKKEKIKTIKNAEDVWQQKSGSSDEIALLFVAMARAAGLKAYAAQVVNRDRAIFDSNYLQMKQLDDYIAILDLSGKDIFLDPGEKMCPFGLMAWKHTIASGLRDSDKGPEYVSVPAETYRQNVVQRVGDINIDASGNVSGILRFILLGQDALHWRQIALQNDAEEVKKQFNESMKAYIPEGIQADFDHFLGLQDMNATLMGFVKISGSMGAVTGKHFFLPGLFCESKASHPFVTEANRSVPVDVHYPKLEEDEIVYHLPEGYGVEGLPQPVSINWPDHAVLTIKAKAEGKTVTVSRLMAYNFTLLEEKAYPDLRGFYQKVATADQEQLVLSRASVAKGN